MKTEKNRYRLSSDPGSFWGLYSSLVRNKVIPYQWAALNDQIEGAEPSCAIANFRIAAGLQEGEFHGFVFQDSDVGKWIEAVAWSLMEHPDPALEMKVDSVVEILEKAQQSDGYLNTYFMLKEPGKRWTNLTECHELYSAGHLLEGAVAYFRATGKRRFLDVMERYVDLIDATFGPQPGKIRGYDGHEEIEMALLRLYEVSANPRHLALAQFFIDERGQGRVDAGGQGLKDAHGQPVTFFHEDWEKHGRISHWSKTLSGPPGLAYHQAHLPVREQTVAVGHAVRAVYLYTAMAELAGLTGDAELTRACETLWEDVTGRQMYVTGGIGSTNHGEAFSFGHDLPNDTVYAETCASIGLMFFGRRMLERSPDHRYADVMERLLYNTVLGSMAQDGQHFFYVNPLEVWPEASAKNPSRHHIKAERQAWFGCACCPPNLARLVASLGQYAFTVRELAGGGGGAAVSGAVPGGIWIHQYLDGRLEGELAGAAFALEVETELPWGGRTTVKVNKAPVGEATLALRIPAWCRSWKLTLNGTELGEQSTDGYAKITRTWAAGDRIELQFEMEVLVLEANPLVRADAGKVCLQRGPLVYCLEEADNGANLSALALDPAQEFVVEPATDLPGKTLVLRGKAIRRSMEGWQDQLYRPVASRGLEPVDIVAIPYFLWGNRGRGEMSVWIRRV